jgi:hypothetical protein
MQGERGRLSSPLHLLEVREDEFSMKWRLVLVGICIILCFPSIVWARETPSIYLQASSLETNVGQTLTVTVYGKDLVDLYGYELNVSFQSKMFDVKSVASGVKGFSVPAIIKGDLLTFAHTKIGGTTAGDNGTIKLAIITLESRLEGKASFTMQNAKLVNSKLAEAEIAGDSSLSMQVLPKSKLSFHDIDKHWAKEDILRAASLGLVKGFPDGTFRPQAQVNRAEFTAMLARALNLNSDALLSYADQQNIPLWSQPSIAAASAAGIVTGYPDHTFRAGSFISRAEMAVMVIRGAGDIEITGQIPLFKDKDDIPSWAQASVAAAANDKLIQGRGNNRFAPGEFATRAEALKIVLNLLDYLKR